MAIRTGLVSITFRKLAPSEIVELVSRSGLEGIEWGGDIHVPHGQVQRAREVCRMTAQAGLQVAAYGSYYRVGVSESEGLRFEVVLETALALGAPTVRVWAGNRGSAEADAVWWSTVVEESRRIADLAQAAGLTISYEFHSKTLTDTNASALRLLREVGHPGVRSYWQPPVGGSEEYCLEGLRGVSCCLSNVHVFHWVLGEQGTDRRVLAEGASPWAQYLVAVGAVPGEHYAMIEFVRGDAPAQFLADAETLKTWVGGAESALGLG